MDDELRIIISGGGTGGHIFPAVSIANAIKAQHPGAKILFVGALGRMEMQRVPAAGYEIKGLPICGFDRKNMLHNVKVLFKIWKSQRMARRIIREFRPMAAVGVGGYASGPTLNEAAKMGVPCLLQEQNSYAGVTNKLLARKAQRICVAYDGMDRFFPADKIMKTGNPVRQSLTQVKATREEALASFGLSAGRKTILIVGGSLGARSLNEAVARNLPQILAKYQLIHIAGKNGFNPELQGRGYVQYEYVDTELKDLMALADIVVSRAGSNSIFELASLYKPMILVPLPAASSRGEQSLNAQSFVDKGYAEIIRDEDIADPEILLPMLDKVYAGRAAYTEKMRENPVKITSAAALCEQICSAAASS